MNRAMMEMTEVLEHEFDNLVRFCMTSNQFDPQFYRKYDVKRGLRDADGKGVVTGLTEVSDVVAYHFENGERIPAPGELYYQGYNIYDFLKRERRFLFEEATYLLLFGQLPTQKQLNVFLEILSSLQELNGSFTRDVILKSPSGNIMNALQKSVVELYSFDEEPENISVPNVLRQSLQLIGKLPLISVYAYYAYRHMRLKESLLIRPPENSFSTAENILYMLRPNGRFTTLEAEVLDIALVLHMEHGGGNNSTFTDHVVTSTGTDTYSAVCAAISSLKGPRHGGANHKVLTMIQDLKEHVPDWEDEIAIRTYLMGILDGRGFDHSGLIYGLGHAVYTISDPREVILKSFARKLSQEKGLEEEFYLYDRVERIGLECIQKKRNIQKPVCANVDFYSGFVYNMLGIPSALFTPIFAISRISGWSAHRLEELVNKGKIIRPAYVYVGTHKDYRDIEERG